MPHSLEEYIKLATKNIDEFTKLCLVYHPYKEKEEELFNTLYEDEYHFNFIEPIEYARTSSKVLLNVLKRHDSDVNIYYIDWFEKEAFNDEVIEYIDKNDLIDKVFYSLSLCRITDLCILKIKKHREFILDMLPSSINDKIISCIKEMNFKASEIDEYIEKRKYLPSVLVNSNFVLYLLEEGLENVKYFKGSYLSLEFLTYLCNHNYRYQAGHSPELLKYKELADLQIENGNIDILLENNLEINEQSVNLLVKKLIETNHNCLNVRNEFLLKNNYFLSQIINYLNINTSYNLEKRYLISNLGRTLENLRKIFSHNDIEIIKREIIGNNYEIDMIGILNNIDLNKLKEIYDKLYKKEIKFNSNFSFYYFIKVMDYFASHLSLVSELNKNVINSEIIDNLALAINCNDNINYEDLKNYISIYKKKIELSNLSYEDKIYRLLINSNRGKSVVPDKDIIESFLEDIIDIPQLTYLQLEFNPNSNEYRLLESYIELSKLLHNIQSLNDEELKEKYFDLEKSFTPNSIFDLEIIRENVLRLYAKIYCKNSLNLEELRKKYRCKTINGFEIYNIEGEEFNLFIHDEEFHPVDDDFTGYDISGDIKEVKNNYLCCEFASDLSYRKLTHPCFSVYTLDNPNSLIAFGNRDVWIKHTTKPLIEARYKFVNQYDMALFHANTHANTEFDFLRTDDKNNNLSCKFEVFQNMEQVMRYIRNRGNCRKILIFDASVHEKCLKYKMTYWTNHIHLLDYKTLYSLIAIAAKFDCLDNYIDEIQKRINELNEKEQLVLKDALNKYSLYVDTKRKVKKY